MGGILEWIPVFLVAYGCPCASSRGWRVRRRFLSLVLFGTSVVLQFARISIFNRSALACFPQIMSGDAGEDEEGEVDDPESIILAIHRPLEASCENGNSQ